MVVTLILSFAVGVSAYFLVRGSAENFFVAGRSLSLPIVSITLAAQAIDSNALLGNVDLSYKYSFWDGVVLPLGLSLSLILNGIFLADKVHRENVLTLPDIFAKRYGKVVELLVSISTVVSFMMLLAGNLVGMGVILAYLWQIEESGAIWISSAIIWAYTVSGGLFSVAYTDIIQGGVGWLGVLVFAFWFIVNEHPAASPPSIGYPGLFHNEMFHVREIKCCVWLTTSYLCFLW